MAQVRGTVLTERDRLLVGYLGLARYLSAEQVHRLVVASSNRKLVYRRLAKLCRPGSRPGDAAYLRRLEFRRPEGTAVPVWALAPAGRVLAEASVPFLRAPAQKDVGHQFLEHTLRLNDVLVDLAVALRGSPTAPVADLPFRWLCEEDEVLEFTMFNRRTGVSTPALLKPDAILEIPGQRRRLFLEAETGAHSVVTANPDYHGAVLHKAERYAHFFTALPGRGPVTFYARSFPDGLSPVLVFLVHSSERKRKVERAIAEWSGSRAPPAFQVRALTFEESARTLVEFIRQAPARSGIPEPQSRPARSVQIEPGRVTVSGAPAR